MTKAVLTLNSGNGVSTLRGDNMSWPPVAVCIVTFDRFDEIKRTLQSLKSHLKYEGQLHWHLSDDGSPRGYIPRIKGLFPDLHFTHTASNRGGWGVNVNKSMRFLNNTYDYIYLNEDDYVANQDIDITRGVALMESVGSVGHVRYDGVQGHRLTLIQHEAQTHIGKVFYMTVDKKSKGLNVYSNRPHMSRRTWREKLGQYCEGMRLGATEVIRAHSVRDLDTPDTVVFWNYIPRTFDHIGKSRQGSTLDKGLPLKPDGKANRGKK